MSELTDTLVVVVSEETGQLSVARQGALQQKTAINDDSVQSLTIRAQASAMTLGAAH